jgi:hypothetical protein
MANTVPPERIGTVLRAMAEDLVSERRRVLALRLENRELRAQLEAARAAAEPTAVPGPHDPSEHSSGDRERCPYCRRPLPKGQR